MSKVHETATLHLTLRGVNLTNAVKGWFGGTSSPTFKISAFSLGTSELWQTVKTSTRVEADLNPVWPGITVSCKDLCGCDLDRPIQVAVFDQDNTSMGAFETTVSALLKKKIEDLNSVDVSKLYKLQDGGKQVGMIAVMDVRVEEPAAAKLQRAVGEVTMAQRVTGNLGAFGQQQAGDDHAKETAKEISPQSSSSRAPEKTESSSKEKDRDRDRKDRDRDRDRDKGNRDRDRDRRSNKHRDSRRSRHDDDTSESRDEDIPLNEDSVLHLTLEGVNMANVEGWMGCSDPFFQIDASMKGFDGTTMWQGIHRSEHIENSLNPRWTPVKINLDLLCQLDLDKAIRISIYDWEESGKHNPMGHFITNVGAVLQAKASRESADEWDLSKAFTTVLDGEVMGQIVVVDVHTDTPASKSRKSSRSSVIPSTLDQDSILRLTLEGVDMANVEGWLGCSDPFFQVETPMKGPNGSVIWQNVHRSEHIENSLNPRWKPAEMSLDLLCQLDLDKPIRFSLFDWEASGKHNPMGSFLTSLHRLLRSKAEKQGDKWKLERAFITKADDGEEFGKVVVVDVSIESTNSSGKHGKGKKIEKEKRKSAIVPAKVDKHAALVLSLEGVDMANVEGWLGCSDPFFTVATPVRGADTTTWTTIFTSEHKNDNLNPKWDAAILAMDPLCQCDLDNPIRISVQDWEENGKHNPMGFFDTSVNRLLRSQAERQGNAWDLTKAFITKSPQGEEFGKIVVADAFVDPKGAKKAKPIIYETPPPIVAKKQPRKKLTEANKHDILSLSLEGKELANMEGWRLGTSDPFFVLSTSLRSSDGSTTWYRIYRSDHISETLNPKWKPASVDLTLLCQGDYDKPIRIEVFDWEESGTHAPMGRCDTTTQELYGASCGGGSAREGYLSFTLVKDSQDCGKVFVANAEVESQSSETKESRKLHTNTQINKDAMLHLELKGDGLANVEGWLGCSDPFYELASSREGPRGSLDWETVYTSKHVPNSLAPKWKPAWVDLDSLCELNLDKLVKLSVFDWEENNEHRPMGECLVTVNLLLGAVATRSEFIPVQDDTELGKIIVTGAAIESSSSRPQHDDEAELLEIGNGSQRSRSQYSGSHSGTGSAHSRDSYVSGNSRPRSQYSGSYDSRQSGSRRSLQSGDSFRSDRSGGSKYSDEYSKRSRGSDYSGSYDSPRSRSKRSLQSKTSFRSSRSGGSRYSDDYSKRSGQSDYSGADSAISLEQGSHLAGGSQRSRSQGSRSLSSKGSGHSRSQRSRSLSQTGSGDSISQGSLPLSPGGSKGSLSQGSKRSGGVRSYRSGSGHSVRSGSIRSDSIRSGSQRSKSLSRSGSRGSLSQRSLSQNESKRSFSQGSKRSESVLSYRSGSDPSVRSGSIHSGDSRSYRSNTSRSRRSLSRSNASRSYRSSDSRSRRSLSRSVGTRSYRSNDSRSRRSLSRSVGSRSYKSNNGGSYRSNDSRSRRSRSRSTGSRSYRSNGSGSFKSYDSRSRRSGGRSPGSESYRSNDSRSYRSGDSRSRRSSWSGSRRSFDSRSKSTRSYRSRSRSPNSYDSRSIGSRSYRSGDSRSRRSSWSGSRSYDSRSRSSRSYDSRSRSSRSYDSRSRSSRSYDSRSRSYSGRSRSGSRSYSSRSRSRSRSYSSRRSDVSGRVLKSSAWEALQSQANEEEEELADLKFYLTLRGLKLANVKGWFGKTAPFFQLSAHSVGTSQIWQPVYTSEAIEGELNPQWKPASMSLDLLCGGNLDKRILVSIFDQNEKTGKNQPMGRFETTVNKLIELKVGGFGSVDNFDESKTIRLIEDGKEMGFIVCLSAHADAPKPKKAHTTTSPKEARRGKSDASYNSYDSRSRSRSRRSRSRSTRKSRMSRSRTSSGRSRSSRISRGSSWRSYDSRSDYSTSSRGSKYSRSDRSGSGSDSESSGSEQSYSEESLSLQSERNGLSEDASLHLTLYGVHLANVEGWLGTSDPFIQIAAYSGTPGPQMWQNIFRSEYVPETLNPKFAPFEVNLDLLCKRDLDQPIQFSVFDWEENGKHQPMGSFQTTVNGLLEAKVYVGEGDQEVDTSKAFTVMHNGEVYGSIVVAAVRVENPDIPRKIKSSSSRGEKKKSKKSRKKGRKKNQHLTKFNTHGDELSIGTIESNGDEQILGEPKNVFGDENEDDTKSRPWKDALPTNAGLGGFDDDIGNLIMGEDENDDGSKDGSITNFAEIFANVEEGSDDSGSDESDSDDSEGSDDDKDGSEDGDDDDDKEDTEHSKEDENDAMLEMMSSMAQSMSYLAAAPNSEPDVEVDLEKFDEMYDQVIVDSKVVAEFQKKQDERVKRGKKNAGEENEDPDLLRDTPRLILFESEKESKKKRGRKKKKDGAKFSQEFIDAMRTVFGDSDESDSEDEDGEEKKDDDDERKLNVSFANKRGSDSSLFVGDLTQNESKEEKSERDEDSVGEEDDEMGKSQKSVTIRVPPSKKRSSRKKRAPKVDPAEIFASERRRQEGMKILSTSGLKQEMADMKKGLTRKMMERELANLRKATSNKFSPFDKKPNNNAQGLFDDYNSSATKAYGAASAAKQVKAKPAGNAGLMDHLAKNDDLKDEGRMKFDDLATVAVGAATGALPALASIPSLNALPAAAQRGAIDAKKKAGNTLGAIGQTAQALGAGAGEQIFFSAQNAGDDDESQANVGLTGNKPVDTGGKAGLTKGQSNRKFPTFSFGKKKGGGGVQLDDDDGGYINSEY